PARRSTPSLRACVSSSPPPSVISSLSLHDALPISVFKHIARPPGVLADDNACRTFLGCKALFCRTATFFVVVPSKEERRRAAEEDRKSTRLNSSHVSISYAVFCLKKKSTDACRWFA